MEINLSNMTTETRNPESTNLDLMSSFEIVSLMNREDSKVPEAIKPELYKISQVVDLCVESLEAGGRIIYVGAGTSGRLGVVDAAECPPTFGVPSSLVLGLIAGGDGAFIKAVEGAEDDFSLGKKDLIKHNLTKNDTVVGLAASGRTPYVIGALEYAKAIGANTASIACNKDSKIGKVAEIVIDVDAGPEILTGSTRLKAGTAQKLILNMISTASMVRIGKCYKNLMVDLMLSNAKLHVRAQNIIMDITGVTRKDAINCLEKAKGSVKKALVMILLDCNFDEAEELLEKTKGHIRLAIKQKEMV